MVPTFSATQGRDLTEYDYDADGRRVETLVKNAAGTVTSTQTFGYDPAGRLTTITNDGPTYATFEYAHGFLTQTTFANENVTKRFYDQKGRLEHLEHLNDILEVLASIQYTYDKRDRRTEVYYAHLDAKSTFTYTDNSWLASETHNFNAGGPSYSNLEASSYGGNESDDSAVVSCSVGGGGASGMDRSIAYYYDLRGNRLTKDVDGGSSEDREYDYDDEDRLLTEGPLGGSPDTTYTYAGRGDLISKEVSGGATTDYYNDYLGRLTCLAVDSTPLYHYTYAPTGDRVIKRNIVADTAEWYLPDGGDTICDYTKAGSSAEVFSGVYVSPGVDGRVARIGASGSGSAMYYFGDALQSVHLTTDASAAVVRKQFTDAWGNEIDISGGSGSGPGARYGFTGRENDTESGLMHYRARSFDPLTGRFTSRDPVLHSNLYMYVENNPVNMVDPTGRDGEPGVDWPDTPRNRMLHGMVPGGGGPYVADTGEKSPWAEGKEVVTDALRDLYKPMIMPPLEDSMHGVDRWLENHETLESVDRNVATPALTHLSEFEAGVGSGLTCGLTDVANEALDCDVKKNGYYFTGWVGGTALQAMIGNEAALASAAAKLEARAATSAAEIPIVGDAGFCGPVPSGSWRLTQDGMGAHLAERSVVADRSALSALDTASTPRYYPAGTAEAAGQAHLRLHEATAEAGIALKRGANAAMSDEALLQAYQRAYSNPSLRGIRGDVRLPDGSGAIANDVDPAGAWGAMMNWFQSLPKGPPQ
jgi:RHS repeat-associated protein